VGVTTNSVPIRGIVVLGCAVLNGCAVIGSAVGLTVGAIYTAASRIRIEDASGLSTDDLRQLQQVRFYNTDNDLIYTSVGHVKGLSCKADALRGWIPDLSELNGRTPEEAAKTQLRIQAMRAGANAVLNPICLHNESADWPNNCWQSWVCEGQAICVGQR
jgi:hypothetical protein